MFKVLLYLWENYGLDVLQLGIICFFGWKILTNHWKHLQEDITLIKEKVNSIEIGNSKIRERVSTIEGKLSK